MGREEKSGLGEERQLGVQGSALKGGGNGFSHEMQKSLGR